MLSHYVDEAEQIFSTGSGIQRTALLFWLDRLPIPDQIQLYNRLRTHYYKLAPDEQIMLTNISVRLRAVASGGVRGTGDDIAKVLKELAQIGINIGSEIDLRNKDAECRQKPELWNHPMCQAIKQKLYGTQTNPLTYPSMPFFQTPATTQPQSSDNTFMIVMVVMVFALMTFGGSSSQYPPPQYAPRYIQR